VSSFLVTEYVSISLVSLLLLVSSIWSVLVSEFLALVLDLGSARVV